MIKIDQCFLILPLATHRTAHFQVFLDSTRDLTQQRIHYQTIKWIRNAKSFGQEQGQTIWKLVQLFPASSVRGIRQSKTPSPGWTSNNTHSVLNWYIYFINLLFYWQILGYVVLVKRECFGLGFALHVNTVFSRPSFTCPHFPVGEFPVWVCSITVAAQVKFNGWPLEGWWMEVL